MNKNCITLLTFTLCCLSKTTQTSEQPQHPLTSCQITEKTDAKEQPAHNMLAALKKFSGQLMRERGIGARTQFELPQSDRTREQNTTEEQNGLVESDWFTHPPIGYKHTALILCGTALLGGIIEMIRFYTTTQES
jgi:hypothetical protein